MDPPASCRMPARVRSEVVTAVVADPTSGNLTETAETEASWMEARLQITDAACFRHCLRHQMGWWPEGAEAPREGRGMDWCCCAVAVGVSAVASVAILTTPLRRQEAYEQGGGGSGHRLRRLDALLTGWLQEQPDDSDDLAGLMLHQEERR